MKKIFNAFLALAMVITAGMTLTSCSVDDNPTTPQNSLAQQLVGEWIFELETDGIEDYDFDEDTKALAEEAKIAVLYHFYSNGKCWKEINLMNGDKLMNQPVGRYATEKSTYTIDASGRVVIAIKDADTGIDQSEELTFDGSRLTTLYAGADAPITLVRATDAQTQFYKAESDAWHGGSDDGGVAEGHPFSESVVGEIVGSDGLAYAADAKGRLPEGVSAVAMVAYRSDTRGLAVQLFSTRPEKKTWNEAQNYVNSLAPVPGARWMIPTRTDWKNMILACAKEAEERSNGNVYAISNAFDFYVKMAKTGIYKTLWALPCWVNEGPEALPTTVTLADILGTAQFEGLEGDLASTTLSCIPCLAFSAEGHVLSKSVVGEIVGSDGLAYAVADKDYLPTGVSAAAMVAYNNGTSGLAIALADEPEDMDWSTANGPSGAAAHTPAVAGQTWKLPSLEDFRQMFISTDGDALQSWVMNRNLTLAGGTPLKASLQDNAGYWMSSEWEGDVASHLRHYDSRVGYNRVSKSIVSSVRACFAFNAKGRALSESAVGDIVGTDGMVYYVADKDNLPEGVSAAAMVAYKNGSHGLAIALADEPDKMTWTTAMGETGAKAHTPVVVGRTWKMPSPDEWMQMLGGFGDEVTNLGFWKGGFCVNFNAALKAAGGELEPDQYYWASSMFDSDPTHSWVMHSNNGSFLFTGKDKDNDNAAVRVCFAF